MPTHHRFVPFLVFGMTACAGAPGTSSGNVRTPPGARVIDGRDLGTIAAGKIADLVLLDADPIADIRNTRRIVAVVQGGRVFDRRALDELLRTTERSVSRSTSPP